MVLHWCPTLCTHPSARRLGSLVLPPPQHTHTHTQLMMPLPPFPLLPPLPPTHLLGGERSCPRLGGERQLRRILFLVHECGPLVVLDDELWGQLVVDDAVDGGEQGVLVLPAAQPLHKQGGAGSGVVAEVGPPSGAAAAQASRGRAVWGGAGSGVVTECLEVYGSSEGPWSAHGLLFRVCGLLFRVCGLLF